MKAMLTGTAGEAAAEFFGTFVLIVLGAGVVAQTVPRGFPWRKVLPYAAAQVAGAFTAAAAVYAIYREAFFHSDGGVRQVTGPKATAGIFSTYPQDFLSLTGGFIDQVAGTAILLALIFAIIDPRNVAPPGWLFIARHHPAVSVEKGAA